MKPIKSKSFRPPVVRREPPTIDEAVFAAIGLTDDVDQQVEIAASLMGIEPDEVRPHVMRMKPVRAASGRIAAQVTIRDRVVTVERANIRRIVLPPRSTGAAR